MSLKWKCDIASGGIAVCCDLAGGTAGARLHSVLSRGRSCRPDALGLQGLVSDVLVRQQPSQERAQGRYGDGFNGFSVRPAESVEILDHARKAMDLPRYDDQGTVPVSCRVELCLAPPAFYLCDRGHTQIWTNGLVFGAKSRKNNRSKESLLTINPFGMRQVCPRYTLFY